MKRPRIRATIDKDTLIDEIRERWSDNGESVLDVLAKASQDVCPVRTGNLRDSCEVEMSSDGGSVTYTADYAAIVHERPSGQSKFLENPANDAGVHSQMLEQAASVFKL